MGKKQAEYYLVEYENIGPNPDDEDHQLIIMGKQPRTNLGRQTLDAPGWLGTSNDVWMYYHGAFKTRDAAIKHMHKHFPKAEEYEGDEPMADFDDVWLAEPVDENEDENEAKPKAEADKIAAVELFNHIMNPGTTIYKRFMFFVMNYNKKVKKGIFDETLAVKGFINIASAGWSSYKKEFYKPGSTATLDMATKQAIAKLLLKEYNANWKGKPLPGQNKTNKAGAAKGKNAVKGPRMTFKGFAADNLSNEAIDAIIKNAPKKSLEGEHGFTYWENIADKYSKGLTTFNKAGAAASSKKKANRTEQGEMRDELQDDDMILMDNGDVIVYSQGSGYDSIGNFKSDFHEDEAEMWEAIFVSMNQRQYWGNVWKEYERGDPKLVTTIPKMEFLKLTKLETPAQALKALKDSGAEDANEDNAKYHVGEFYLDNDTEVKAPFSLRVEKGDKDAAKYGKQKVFFVVNGQDDKTQVEGWLYKGYFYLLPGKWQDIVEGLNDAKHGKGF